MFVLVRADIVHHFLSCIPPDYKHRYSAVPWESIPAVMKKPPTLSNAEFSWMIVGPLLRLRAALSGIR